VDDVLPLWRGPCPASTDGGAGTGPLAGRPAMAPPLRYVSKRVVRDGAEGRTENTRDRGQRWSARTIDCYEREADV